MCVAVRIDDQVDGPSAEMDLDDLAIRLSAQLTPEQALILARRLLARVGVDQPSAGAVCWCGASIDMADLTP